MLAPATNAQVLSGILAEERAALVAARDAADHHRATVPRTTADEQTRLTMVGRYDVLAEVHRRRVHVLEDLLALDVAMPAMPDRGANVVYLEYRR